MDKGDSRTQASDGGISESFSEGADESLGQSTLGADPSAWTPFCAAVKDLLVWEQTLAKDVAKDVAKDAAEAPASESVEGSGEVEPGLSDVALEADGLGSLSAILEDGEADTIPLSELLRLRGLPYPERMALGLCAGRVLDVGAGSGVHSLMLQQGGHDVTALDAQPELVAVQRSRGIADVRCGDIMLDDWDRQSGERWNTLLLMMNGLGVCGDLDGLPTLLERCRGLLEPEGVILADGCDLRTSPAPEEAARIERRETNGRSFGEATLEMIYQPAKGPTVFGTPFPWLYLDYETLASTAELCGWGCQRVFDSGPDYLARLVRG